MKFKSPQNQKGSSSLAFFLAALLVGMLALGYYLSHLPQHRPAPPAKNGGKEIAETPEEQKIRRLEEELFNLYTSLDSFEAMKNRRKYLQVLQSAENHLVALDNYWEKKTRGQKGALDGLRSGMNEYFEVRFSADEKLEMLALKFGMPARKLRRLKADLEIMFSEELAEKFSAPAEEEPAPAPAGDRSTDGADPKTAGEDKT